MKVSLIAFMQMNPEYLYEHDWQVEVESEPEWMASACMRSTRTNKPFHEILNESDKETTAERMKESVKMGHFTVAGMTDFIFFIEGISRACSHQLVRHRTAWFLQQSQRAVDPTEQEFIIPPKMIQWQNNHGNKFDWYIEMTKSFYREMVADGVPKEDARFLLPNATPTRVVMKIDGSNLIHLLKLRTEKHSQWEIRELANKMWDEVKKVCPNLFSEDLKEYWW